MGFQTASCKVTTGRKCAANRLFCKMVLQVLHVLVVLLHGLVARLRGLVVRLHRLVARLRRLVGCAFAHVGCAFAQVGWLCICTGWVRRFFTATSLNLTDFCQVSECRENGQVS